MSALLGPANLSFQESLAGAIDPNSVVFTIVWEIRVPRAMAAFLAGAALGGAGAALQGLLRNPLAGPGVLGISAMASLGAVFVIYFGLVAAIGGYAVPIGALLGAFLATGVLLLSLGRQTSPVTVILIGLGLSSLAGALLSLAMNLAPKPSSLSDMINWLLGSVVNRSWNDIGLIALPMIIGTLALSRAGPGLRVLSLGEETAMTLGRGPSRTRAWVVLGSGALVGGSVALAGTIGFVGIVAPHLLRRLVTGDPAGLILPSALLGGILLVFTDLLIRTVPAFGQINLGVAVALIGAPVFIWIASDMAKAWSS
ncbi:MAG: iron ABC transporter permease [Pseudomonadota bacterium]